MVPRRSMGCPWCGSSNVEAPTVDIGVGKQQCGPMGCNDCQSFQIDPSDEEQLARATVEEINKAWFKGPDVEESKRHQEKLNGIVR